MSKLFGAIAVITLVFSQTFASECRNPAPVNDGYPSATKGYLLDHLIENNAFEQDGVNVHILDDEIILSDTYTMWDDNDGLYYPKHYHSERFYFPAGISEAKWEMVGYPNDDYQVFYTFIPNHTTDRKTINHANPVVEYETNLTEWDMNETVMSPCVNGCEARFNTDVINASGGGWLYVDIVENIQDPEHIAQPEHQDQYVSAAPWVSISYSFRTKTHDELNTWLSNTKFAGCGGDPTEARGPIHVIDKPLPGTTTRYNIGTIIGNGVFETIGSYMTLYPDAGASAIPDHATISKEEAGADAVVPGLQPGDNGHMYSVHGFEGIDSLSNRLFIESLKHKNAGSRIGFSKSYDLNGSVTMSVRNSYPIIRGRPVMTKTYIPAGATEAKIAFQAHNGNTHLAYMAFVGENERGKDMTIFTNIVDMRFSPDGNITIDSIAKVSAIKTIGMWNGEGTAQVHYKQAGSVTIDGPFIEEKGGGWVYIALWSGKQGDYAPVTVLSQVTLGDDPAIPDGLIDSMDFLSPCGGDPSETAGSLQLAYLQLYQLGVTLTGPGGQHYDSLDDYYHGHDCGDDLDEEHKNNLLTPTGSSKPTAQEGSYGFEKVFVERTPMRIALSWKKSGEKRGGLFVDDINHTKTLVRDTLYDYTHTLTIYEKTSEILYETKRDTDIIMTGVDAAIAAQ